MTVTQQEVLTRMDKLQQEMSELDELIRQKDAIVDVNVGLVDEAHKKLRDRWGSMSNTITVKVNRGTASVRDSILRKLWRHRDEMVR